MKKLLLLLTLSLFQIPLLAQVSEGGTPPSFKAENAKSFKHELKSYITKQNVDVDQLIQEDEKQEDNRRPIRVAVVIPAEVDLAKDGVWETLPSGERICRLVVKAPNALGVIPSYDTFYIPKGGRLFIYNKDKSQILGAYTHRTNPSGKGFSTEIIYGDEFTLEYVDTPNAEKPRIKIEDLGYAYNNIHNYSKTDIVEGPGFNLSGSCQVNVNCSEEGANWQDQKKGVARTYAKIAGLFWGRCSGSLINNTNNDKTPYFLSANHCYYEWGDSADFETMQFYFNYESVGCNNETIQPTAQSMIGAEMLATSPIDGGSDGALLKLKNKIPESYNVYFNGWDRTNTPATSGVVIHHPQGDVKKISTYNTSLTTGSYSDGSVISLPNVHWGVTFASTINGYGTTEGGSSGSPIFNQEGLIVGSLTGGNTSCSNPTGRDLFSKLYYNWDQDPNVNIHMNKFLDPKNSNAIKLLGIPNIDEVKPPTDNAPSVYSYWENVSGKGHSTLILKTGDDDDTLKNVRIINFRGYEVYNSRGTSMLASQTIDASAWAIGLYIVIVETEKGFTRSFKIIK